ncbi:hypothetical protein RhiirC2_721392 [Rhizophagus irregularis]|uniref:Uncharacterized protein n=1 Tax=Rhizophagus irregularis TaxID=588596 RepID=A0A2N1M6A1_9GLOM|nr:hypothetical protein RhiirC2_721392 [Rhizophagus irregularis]
MEGVDIKTAIREIQGTSVTHLEPNRTRDQNKKAKNTLPGNSNLFEWTCPGDGPMEGYILGREVPNIGEWTQFSPARIANLQKNKIEIPKPTVSAHTVPKSQWIVSMPNTSGIDPKRLTKEQLSLELTKQKINVVKTAKRDELIRELELAITNNIEIIQESGWALKSKQKYGKRGSGKRLSKRVWKILEEYFLEGDVDKSKRYTAATMLESLKKKVEGGELGNDEIPKLQTVQSWISRYSAQHHQKMAEIPLNK